MTVDEKKDVVTYPVNDDGQLSAALDTAEGGTLPHATGDQLEGPGLDGLAGLGNTDDGAHTPALVAALKRGPHGHGVTCYAPTVTSAI